jgi:hypothetical protein
MARPRIVVSENHRRSIVSRYDKGEGLRNIGKALGYKLQIVRRVLVENGIEIKDRGRPVTV